MKQRVLILGAGGFIGRRIVQALAATSWAQPVAGARRAQTVGAIETITVDATDQGSLQRALVNCSAVVNCVAGSAETIQANARALIASAAGTSGDLRVVHLSSLAAYGSSQGLVTEEMPLRGDLDPYSRSKADAEQILGVYPNRVVLRPGIVYGPGSAWWSDRIARLLVAKRLGDLGRNGDGICNLVFVDDVAQAVVRALEVREIAGEAFNLSLPDAPTWNGYFTAYARSLGATPIKRISPQRLAVELKVLAPLLKLGEMAGRIGPLRKWQPAPAIRPWLTTLCRHEIRMSVERADSRLGMRWTPLEQGLETTARWFLAGGRA